MKVVNALVFVLFTVMTTYAQQSPGIGLNTFLSARMMDQNQELRKIDILLESRQAGLLPGKSLVLGASVIAIADFQHTNTDSKFAYLMRHPTANNSIGTEASEVVLHSAQLSFTGAVNSWIAVYGEMLYNPEQSFGTGTITSLDRNRIEFRKGIVVLGDLDAFPLYFAIGKMDVAFGQMGSVNPFTNSTMWHAFGGLAYSAAFGFNKYGLNARFTAIQGGSQFRALNVPVDSTSVPSRVNNYSVDVNYTFDLTRDIQFRIGGSYLKGTTYCHSFPVFHFLPCDDNNPAYTYYASANWKNKLILKGGFAKTTDVWLGTHNPHMPLDFFEASKVSSLDYGFQYRFAEKGAHQFAFSGEFSNFVAGPEGAPWERQNQIIIGLSNTVNQSSRLFLEFFSTKGYAPLNFISGGNMDHPGKTHSVRDASSFGFVLGANIML